MIGFGRQRGVELTTDLGEARELLRARLSPGGREAP